MRSPFPNRPNLHRPLPTSASVALILAVGVPTVGISSTAFAAEPEGGGDAVRYERKTRSANAKAGLLETKFSKAKKAEDKKKTRDPKMMSGAEFAKKRVAVEQEMADKQIAFLKRLIKTTEKSDAEYPDLLFRLSDHYLEKKAYFDNQAGALFEKIWDAEDKGNNSKAKTLKQRQKRLKAEGKKSSKMAAKVYHVLVSDPAFAKYKRMDEALYYFAFELGELGEESRMQKTYQRLIHDYPDSQYISQAYLAFADYYFDRDNIQAAARLYEKVTTFKNSPVFAYALYKLGWCHLNPVGTAEPRYDKSLNYFVATIQATKEGRAGSEENGKQLRRDARRDLIRAYVYASKPSKAHEFFNRIGKGPGKGEDDVRRMMLLLANQYFGEGMYAESTYVYKRMQSEWGGDEDRCDWQGKVVVNTLASDNKKIQWLETQKLGEFWTEYKSSRYPKAVKRKCRDDALKTIKQMATVWHDEAYKTQRPETYELAEKAYHEFLKVFPKDKDAYELQYYYSELLWALASNHYNSRDQASRNKGLGYFLTAHEQFVKTLEMKPKGKYTRDAAYAQMLAMKNHLEYDETGGKSKACKTNTEGVCVYREKKRRVKKRNKDTVTDRANEYPVTEYTPEEKKMLASYDLYTKYVDKKDDKELPKIMYHRAKLMMVHNKFDDALPLVKEIVEKFDGSLYAAWCAAMLVDILTIRWTDKANSLEQTLERSDDLETWAKKLQKMKVWNHPEAAAVQQQVPMLLAGIGWRKAKAYADAGTAYVKGEPGGDPAGFSKCTKQYLQVYYDFENHPKADALLYSAAICATAGYQIAGAINIRKALAEEFPESEYAKENLHLLAGNYMAVAYYPLAAERYEAYAEKYPKDSRTPEALQNAYLFRLGLGDTEQASENLRQYEGMYKKKDAKRAAGIFWTRYKTLTNDEDRMALAKDYIKTYGKKGGVDRLVVAESSLGEILWRKACPKPLIFDSCLSIERRTALAGAKTVEERKRLEAKAKRDEQRRSKRKFKPPERCGSETQAVITVYKRDKKLAAQAQNHFATALKLTSKGKVDIPEDEKSRVEDFRNAWGAAIVFQADQDYENYLQIEMPTGLSFAVESWRKGQGVRAWDKLVKKQEDKRKDSLKRIKDFLDSKTKLGLKLQESYAKTKKTGSPFWILAGAARTAMVLQNFADQLYRAEVPDEIKSEEGYFAYCDELSDRAKPIADQALESFNYCISRSTEFQFFNTYSRLCEKEMQQWNPEMYPATNEAFGRSVYTRSRIAQVGVLRNSTGTHEVPVVRETNKKGNSGSSRKASN